jgi:hypothetical protein
MSGAQPKLQAVPRVFEFCIRKRAWVIQTIRGILFQTGFFMAQDRKAFRARALEPKVSALNAAL